MWNYRKPPKGIVLIAYGSLTGGYWLYAMLSHDSTVHQPLSRRCSERKSVILSAGSIPQSLISLHTRWSDNLITLATGAFCRPHSQIFGACLHRSSVKKVTEALMNITIKHGFIAPHVLKTMIFLFKKIWDNSVPLHKAIRHSSTQVCGTCRNANTTI